MCNITRDESFKKYGRDFYLSRRTKSVLCKKCFLKKTGKILGDNNKNKWKKFYN